MTHRKLTHRHRSLPSTSRTCVDAGELFRPMKALSLARLAFLSALLVCASACSESAPATLQHPEADRLSQPEDATTSRWHRCVPANVPFADLLGVHRQGRKIANHVHFSLSSVFDADDRPIEDARIERGALVRGAASPAFQGRDGTYLQGGSWAGVKLHGVFDGCTRDTEMTFDVSARIVSATAHEELRGAWEYQVEIQEPEPREPGAKPAFVPLCKGGKPALVVPGAWDKQGRQRNENGLFSFACPDTAAAKCAGAMKYNPGYAEQNPDIPALYGACTRMVIADYCGDGDSATQDGTRVDVWDSAHVEERDPQDGRRFEAAWTQDGAVCMHHPRWPKLLKRACRDRIPMCGSPEEAQALVPPGTALLFNSSSEQAE